MSLTTKVGAFPSSLKPTDAPSQADKAYHALKRLILDNELPTGRQLLETEAAVLLGMSRTPVREAMLRLEQNGLVEIRARHGMQVLPIHAADMKEIYQVLTALECAAAELAASRKVSAEELKPLEDAIRAMDTALGQDELLAWAAADERFHLALVHLAENSRITHLVGMHWEQSHRVRIATLGFRPKPTRSNKDHAALVKAIRKGDPEEARRIHHEHRTRNAKILVELLEKLGAKPL